MERIWGFSHYPTFKKENYFIQEYAFSLIELSLVLIIIGLLVAGITGGASLIESAKVRGLINEFNGYKQAVHTFYTAKGRLPGDLNQDGIIGTVGNYDVGETYTADSFPAPYNVVAPKCEYAPFIDLYLEKLIDHELDPEKVGKDYRSNWLPSKISNGSYYSRFQTWKNKSNCSPCFPNSGIVIYFQNTVSGKYGGVDPKIAKSIDEKIDDGIAKTGNFYSHGVRKDKVGTVKYDEMLDGGKLSGIMYKVFDYN